MVYACKTEKEDFLPEKRMMSIVIFAWLYFATRVVSNPLGGPTADPLAFVVTDPCPLELMDVTVVPENIGHLSQRCQNYLHQLKEHLERSK